MRIRKHAAKLLLGSACPPPQQYSPPPPPPAGGDEYDLQSVGDNGLFLCQLNCSPWDVLDLNDSNHFYFPHQQEEVEEDEGKGIMGNVLGYGDEEGIFGISEAFTKSRRHSIYGSSVVVADCEDEDNSDQKKKVKKKRKRRRKEKEEEENNDDDDDEEKTSSVVTVIAKSGGGGQLVPGICKKNDGKGWHCSRPANPNHTLCDHHLTQLKSYGSNRCNNNNNAAHAESEPDAATRVAVKNHNKPDHVRSPVKHRRRKTKAAASATSDKSAGDGYYYYSGFGLSRGKSRSINCRNEDAKVEEPAEEVSAGGHNGSNSGDDVSDSPIAGGDLDDDTDDDDDEPVGNVDNNKGRLIRRKKRGRKPIKARSLKSLL